MKMVKYVILSVHWLAYLKCRKNIFFVLILLSSMNLRPVIIMLVKKNWDWLLLRFQNYRLVTFGWLNRYMISYLLGVDFIWEFIIHFVVITILIFRSRYGVVVMLEVSVLMVEFLRLSVLHLPTLISFILESLAILLFFMIWMFVVIATWGIMCVYCLLTMVKVMSFVIMAIIVLSLERMGIGILQRLVIMGISLLNLSGIMLGT